METGKRYGHIWKNKRFLLGESLRNLMFNAELNMVWNFRSLKGSIFGGLVTAWHHMCSMCRNIVGEATETRDETAGEAVADDENGDDPAEEDDPRNEESSEEEGAMVRGHMFRWVLT